MIFTRAGIWCALTLTLLGQAIHTRAAVPPTPTNVHTAWVDAISSVLIWDDAPEAQSYNVSRFDSTTGEWVAAGSQLTVPMFREAPGQEPPLQYAVTALNADCLLYTSDAADERSSV